MRQGTWLSPILTETNLFFEDGSRLTLVQMTGIGKQYQPVVTCGATVQYTLESGEQTYEFLF